MLFSYPNISGYLIITLFSTRNNTFCDTLALQEKSSYEKIHTKYCKTVLGLKKTACNISVCL
jgi:hypothetical protein